MLKRDDPAFKELVANIKWLVSSRYAEDPEPLYSPFYMLATGDEPGFAFASLNRRDRLELLVDMVPWRDYGIKGITADEQRVIIANVLDGKPAETWLEGVFDRDVQKKAIQNILREDAPEPMAFDRDVQQKAFRDLLRDDAPEPLMGRKEGRDQDGFDRAVSNLRRNFHEHGVGENWEDLSGERKVGYLATFAAVHDAPFERFADAARHVLGYGSREDLTPDDWLHFRRQYQEAMRSRLFGEEIAENATEFRKVNGPDRGRDICF